MEAINCPNIRMRAHTSGGMVKRAGQMRASGSMTNNDRIH